MLYCCLSKVVSGSAKSNRIIESFGTWLVHCIVLRWFCNGFETLTLLCWATSLQILSSGHSSVGSGTFLISESWLQKISPLRPWVSWQPWLPLWEVLLESIFSTESVENAGVPEEHSWKMFADNDATIATYRAQVRLHAVDDYLIIQSCTCMVHVCLQSVGYSL